MPAQCATYAVLSSTNATETDLHVEVGDCSRLLELLSLVPDPRKARGIRHTVAGLPAVAAAAVLAGAGSVLAIGEWAAEAPQSVLSALGSRFSARNGRFVAAHTDTFRRVLRTVNAAAVDTAIGLFLAERAGAEVLFGDDEHADADGADTSGQASTEHVHDADEEPIVGALAVDGKAPGGARQADGRAVHLLSAMLHQHSAVVAQRDVHHKTNEITQVKPLLEPLNLRGWVVTLDALHAQRETARYLVEDKHASYLFSAVKDNQPTLSPSSTRCPGPRHRSATTAKTAATAVLSDAPSGSCPPRRASSPTPLRRCWSNATSMTHTTTAWSPPRQH